MVQFYMQSIAIEANTSIVETIEAGTDTMDDLDSALNELGMLSNVTKYRLEYLQNKEATLEAKKAADKSSSTASDDTTISVSSNFVTNINISTKYNNYNSFRFKMDIQERRLSNHICPRVRRIFTRVSPYTSSRITPVTLMSTPLPKVVKSYMTGRLRGPVMFYKPHEETRYGKQISLFPLDESVTSKLSAIQLTSNDCLTHVVDSNNSTDGNDDVRDLSQNVSRLEIEKK